MTLVDESAKITSSLSLNPYKARFLNLLSVVDQRGAYTKKNGLEN